MANNFKTIRKLMFFVVMTIPLMGGFAHSLLAEKSGLPTLLRHSKKSIAVYQGDNLTVEIEAEGEALQYSWVRNDKTVCRRALCKFNTRNWSLGKHYLSSVVYNNGGSRYLQFIITVLDRPIDTPVKMQKPDLVEVKKDFQTIVSDDLTIEAIYGLGYTYSQKDVKVVGRDKRLLLFQEKLKTQPNALLRFGKHGKEEHFLREKSVASLVRSKSGRRSIILNKGTIRSRNLTDTEPDWSLSVGSWLQIDTDAKGDVIVRTFDDEAEVVVLRGTARIFQFGVRLADKDNEEGKMVVIPQGISYRFKKSEWEGFSFRAPKSTKVAADIRDTTPQFIEGEVINKPKNKRLVSSQLDTSKTKKTLEESLEQGKKFLLDHDPLMALSILLPHAKEAKTNFELSLLIARASKKTYLYDQAIKYYAMAKELKPKNAELFFEEGELYLADELWEKALSEFDIAEDLGKRSQLFDYYMGVAHFQEQNRISAIKNFKYALWENSNSEVTKSSREFVSKVREDSLFDLRFNFGIFSDSNIFRLADDEEAPLNFGKKNGWGYMGKTGFSFIASETERGKWHLSYDIEMHGYLEPYTGDSSYQLLQGDAILTDVNTIEQEIASDFEYNFGGDSLEDSFLGIKVIPYIKTFQFGSRRTLDTLGIELATSFNSVFLKPRLYQHSLITIDPYPSDSDIIDVSIWEITGKSERSSRYRSTGLYLTPYDVGKFKWNIGVEYGETKFRNLEAYASNHTHTLFANSLEYKHMERSLFGADIKYWSKTFDYDDSNLRNDGDLKLAARWQWFFTPNFSSLFKFNYEMRSSDENEKKFTRTYIEEVFSLSY